MSILQALQPSMQAGLKLSKTLIKACIRAKASPAVAAVAALELLSAACEQTQTYLPQLLNDLSNELHVVAQAANQKALDDANPDKMGVGNVIVTQEDIEGSARSVIATVTPDPEPTPTPKPKQNRKPRNG